MPPLRTAGGLILMNSFWTNLVIDVLLVVFVIDCLFMWLVILMQRSKQEGLGAAFGGGMMEGAFGAQTSNILVKSTVWAAIIFFVVSILLARLYSHRTAMLESNASSVQQQLSLPVAPAAPLAAPTNSVGQPVVPTATPMKSSPTATDAHPTTWATPTAMPTNQPSAAPAKK